MAVFDILKPVTSMFGNTFGRVLGQYWWVLFIFVGLAIAVAGVFLWKMVLDKKRQWTHTLIVRRVLQNRLLSKPEVHKMRRFPLIKRAEVFELEKPLLGGYLLPELDQYSGVNEYSIILDHNNRIYVNKGEYFNPDKSSVMVSAKHGEIDISRSDLRADYQNINRTTKRVEWGQIAKYTMLAILIISVMIVSIVAIGEWGDAQSTKAQSESAQAEAMKNLAKALESSEATVNTQLIILDLVKEIFGDNNVQGIIRNAKNGTV